MIFKKVLADKFHCIGFCEYEDDDVIIAEIIKCDPNMKWRANIVHYMPLNCLNIKEIAKKLSELNMTKQ